MAIDYVDINMVTPMQSFSDALSKIKLEFDRQHKPFDEQCARLEYRDKLDAAEKESERKNGFVKIDEIKVTFGDLSVYGDAKLFEFIDEQPHLQDKVIEGSRTQVLSGYTRDYRCKKRGHGISVFVPIDAWNAEKGKKLKKEE